MRRPSRVGRGAGAREHRLRRRDVVAEPAQRVGHVGVDLALVAGQPLIAGASGFERGVERREVQGVVGVEPGHQVGGGGAAEHDGVDPVTVVDQVLLDRERAHAVPEKHDRDTGNVGGEPVQEHADVVDRRGPALRADHARSGAVRHGVAVAARVVPLHDETGAGERGREVLVAPDVLAEAMDDVDCATSGPGPAPSDRWRRGCRRARRQRKRWVPCRPLGVVLCRRTQAGRRASG